MRSSLRIGPLEVELVVPRGELELLVTRSFVRYLGAVEAPVATVGLGELATPLGIVGHLDRPWGLDRFLRGAIGQVGVATGTVLLVGSARLDSGGAHVQVAGDDLTGETSRVDDGVLAGGVLAVHHDGSGWLVSSTPFGRADRVNTAPITVPLGGMTVVESGPDDPSSATVVDRLAASADAASGGGVSPQEGLRLLSRLAEDVDVVAERDVHSLIAAGERR